MGQRPYAQGTNSVNELDHLDHGTPRQNSTNMNIELNHVDESGVVSQTRSARTVTWKWTIENRSDHTLDGEGIVLTCSESNDHDPTPIILEENDKR